METLAEKMDLVKVSAVAALGATGFLAGGFYTAFTVAEGLAGLLLVEFFLTASAASSMVGFQALRRTCYGVLLGQFAR